MNPDAWNLDQYGLDRPGNLELQLELRANNVTNLARYPEWHAVGSSTIAEFADATSVAASGITPRLAR